MKTPALVLASLLFSSGLTAGETALTIDKGRSHIEAAVTSSMDNFTAKLTAYDALISVDVTEKRIGSVRLKFLFADINTGVEERDADMRRWEQADQFPDCVYILDALLPAAGGTFTARGKFILHGVTKTLSIPVTIGYTGNDACIIDGDLPLDTTDFGLPPIHKFLVYKVNPTLQLKFHLEGHVAPDS
jgi:polyisoprenoid-binding protein YceI